MKAKRNTSLDAANAMFSTLKHFIGTSQLSAMRQCMRGEEGQWFIDKLVDLGAYIERMPKTYSQDGLGNEAIVYLHYFTGNCDWYITEKDMENPQHQAFGLADLGYGAELGYISIAEIIKAGAELDLHWAQKTVGDIQSVTA